jgi:predicted regulator of Ras-like GTPase activity (Roadblock/LC7/MglB family)
MDGKTARLVVKNNEQEALIYFEGGNVVHAVLDDAEEGEEVVYKTLHWETGTFNLESGIESPQVTITRSWSGLLLEGARRLDESQFVIEAVEENQFIHPEVNEMSQMDNILKEMDNEVNGYIASAIVGKDGFSISQHTRRVKTVDPEEVGAQMTLLLKLVETSMGKIDGGVIEDNLLTSGKAYLIMRYLPGKEYFLGIAADRSSANLGNLRLMSKLYAKRVTEALPR